MGKQSLLRQRFHSQRTRIDSQGRDYYQERKGRSDSRGRQYRRRYYGKESIQPRDFSRDMISFSRLRNNLKERGRSSSTRSRKDGKRSESKEDSNREYKNCIGCKCESCVKMRINPKEMNMQLCKG